MTTEHGAMVAAALDPYLGRRMRYSASRGDADRAVGPPQPGQMARYAARGWAFGVVASVIGPTVVTLWYLNRVRAVVANDDPFAQAGDAFDLAVLSLALPFALVGAAWLSYLVGYIANWFVPDRLIAGRWELVGEGSVPADAVLTAVHSDLVRRRGPYRAELVGRDHDGSEGTRRYVVVDFRGHRAAVAAVERDGAVWVNWVMWRTVMPIVLVWEYVVDAFWTVFGRAGLREQQVYSEVRAMRECVHAAARAGLNLAVGQTDRGYR